MHLDRTSTDLVRSLRGRLALAAGATALMAGFLVAQPAAAQDRAAAAASDCAALASVAWPDTKITGAQVVQAGAFTPPPGGPGPARPPSPVFKTLPTFCRVSLTLTPTADSDIKSEVWLPLAGWNGKFQVVGNGGWAGNISYPNMAEALAAGYATASTDTGHVNDGSPDNSGDVCRELIATARLPLVYIEHARNYGEHNAVMTGLRHATGDYVIERAFVEK